MAKRGCKLQELVAHTSNVNCVKIGKKECRLLLTGGDDHIVNLWSIGKPTSLMSLCGHTSPVECLAFDSSESLVLGGASSGAIKLWNLEESKMVRTLTGHKSNCTSIEFHPFGEFFASGSQDTDLKIWDIRKKGCIHTYKGHSLGIDAIKFTPEGRWVVSGGRDNVVKVWDLTAGKLLHEFKHDGPIRSLDFHPLEFLLATGSADRTVKFWDLETFEIIGSTRAEATGVRALKFHPDGRTLFCGYDDNMKVYSWEPVICYDSVDIRWSILGDLCISDTKMIACSHHQNSIGIWAAELSLIKPYATNDGSPVQLKHDSGDVPPPSEATGTTDRSTSGSRPATPDTDMKEIKNIYVDYEKPISSKKVRSHHMTKVSPPSAMKETHKLTTKKRTPVIATREKSMSFVVPTIVPRDSADGKVVASPRRRSAGPQGTGSGASIRPVQTRRASNIIGGKSSTASLRSSSGQTYSDSNRRTVDEGSGDFFEDKYPAVNGDRENLESAQCRPRPSNLAAETPVENTLTAKGDTGKINDSTTRVFGRTRSLAEKFERRERPPFGEDSVFETVYTEADVIADRLQRSSMLREGSDFSRGKSANLSDENIIEELIHGHEVLLSGLRFRLTKLQVVKHFWDRNDIKGAIDSMKKLSDHSVQADVISVFIDKMEIINLDILFNLLPVLVHLLDSKIERHAKMSMEMLLKLVANFGEIICSTISAPPAVGVDLHQEQRIQCCRQCFNYLQKVQNTLHVIIRKGGILAKSASELNLVLRDHNIA